MYCVCLIRFNLNFICLTILIQIYCTTSMAKAYAQNNESYDSQAQSKTADQRTKGQQHTWKSSVVLKPTPAAKREINLYKYWPYPAPSFTRNIRYQIDIGMRSTYHADTLALHDFVGLDTYIPIQTRTRTWGKFIVQWYALRDDLWSFDDENTHVNGTFNHELMMVATEVLLLSRGRLALSLGHLKPYYTLRHDVHSTRTIRQMIDQHNVGLRFDWGMALHGKSQDFSYALMLSQGDRAYPWEKAKGSYLLSGRLATLPGALPFQLGLSALSAKLHQGNEVIPRWRTGIDLQYQGPIGALFEMSIGRDYRIHSMINLLAELNWYSLREEWKVYLQQRSLTQYQTVYSAVMTSYQDDQTAVGVLYYPLKDLSVSSEVAHLWDAQNYKVQIQVRYRW
jgi:hypothetical protein